MRGPTRIRSAAHPSLATKCAYRANIQQLPKLLTKLSCSCDACLLGDNHGYVHPNRVSELRTYRRDRRLASACADLLTLRTRRVH